MFISKKKTSVYRDEEHISIFSHEMRDEIKARKIVQVVSCATLSLSMSIVFEIGMGGR